MIENESLIRTRAYINGSWVEAESGNRYDVFNPADGACVGSVPDMGSVDTEAAIDAAAEAFDTWKGVTAGERADVLRRWHALILDNREDLARLMTLEQGKPMRESRGEVEYGAGFVEWFAEEARRAYGNVIPSHAEDKRILALKQPIGVAAAITPWNFPIAMITRKVAPALAVGCTVVSKPAEDTPLCALALAVLAEEAGFPPGVFNVVTTGDPGPVGQTLLDSTTVRKLSFTGSTEVGKMLMSGSADTVKRVSLELGGNAPFIVFDDADIDAAVAGAVASKYRNAGQTCVCANRMYIHNDVYEAFVERFVEAVAALNVGPGSDEQTDIGPLINDDAVAKVERLLKDATDGGASVVRGGHRHERGGTYYEPTVVTEATDEMDIAREEIFGPVSTLYRFADESEVIRRANRTRYGLAAYFYARDVGRIWRVSEGLEYGMVGVNTGMISTPVAPFGGVKQSGFGREGSMYGIDEYLETKYVCMGGLD